MTTTSTRRPQRLLPVVLLGLFCAMFTFSAVWIVVDPDGARENFRFLGYPDFLVYPNAVAKLLGVLAVATRRWRTLADFAWAGFLFDLLLALAAHVHERDPDGWLAVAGLVLWAAAFTTDRRRSTG